MTADGGPRPIVVVGPTASGKTALAIELAEILGDAEIVSVDSMQVYRGMDIGTGKATAAEQARVTHHLLDIVEPSVDFSVAWFQAEARSALDNVAARGRRAILVGGTGLYHRAVVDDLAIPGDYPAVRAELEAQVAGADDPEAATRALHRRLADLDPVGAARTEPTNARRVIRALEVTIGSGRPFSSYGPGLDDYPATQHHMVGLSVDRADMGPVIARRVRSMMAAGFLDEVRSLTATSALSRTARQALGYRELLEHVEGRCSEDESVAATILRTRQYAVRQDRWFRRDPRIEWFGSTAGMDRETRSLAHLIADSLEPR